MQWCRIVSAPAVPLININLKKTNSHLAFLSIPQLFTSLLPYKQTQKKMALCSLSYCRHVNDLSETSLFEQWKDEEEPHTEASQG